MIDLNKRVIRSAIEFGRYFGASALALLIDYACYYFLVLSTSLDLPQAAAVGYIIGLIASYFLIADRVFSNGWLRDRKHYEVALYALSGLLGVALTYGTVNLFIIQFGRHPNLAKLSAVIISFCGVYIFRKLVIFKEKHQTNI